MKCGLPVRAYCLHAELASLDGGHIAARAASDNDYIFLGCNNSGSTRETHSRVRTVRRRSVDYDERESLERTRGKVLGS